MKSERLKLRRGKGSAKSPEHSRREAGSASAKRWAVGLCPFLLALLLWAPQAAADLPAGSFVFAGLVKHMTEAPDGSTYVAGTFTQELAPTGSGIVTPATGSGTPDPGTFPQVVGEIRTVIPDGNGGWYIGGAFKSVGGLPRHGVAHILADGAVDPTVDPYVTFEDPRFPMSGFDGGAGVDALALSGSTLYIGGRFGTIAGQARRSLAAIDTSTGQLTSWNPEPSFGSGNFEETSVDALTVAGSTLYVGGNFREIGGQVRHGLAAFEIGGGQLAAWHPEVERGSSGGVIEAIAPDGGQVYIGGLFTEAGGSSRQNLAAIDATSGSATSWNPGATFEVKSLATSASTVYVAGNILNDSSGTPEVGGLERKGLAAVDRTTGSTTSWNPAAQYGTVVSGLSLSGSTLYVAGNFVEMGGEERVGAAAFNTASTGALLPWNPNIGMGNPITGLGPEAIAVAAAGSAVYVGGEFAGAGAPVATISGIAKVNPDGSLDTAFDPHLCHLCGVGAMALSGSTLWVGGGFSEIGGQTRSSVAALNSASGTATSWDVGFAGGNVIALAVSGATLYVGTPGGFEIERTGRHGEPTFEEHHGLTALSTITAEPLPIPEPENGGFPWVESFAVSGSTLYLGGCFTGIGGEARNGLAALDTTNNTVLGWHPFNGSPAACHSQLVQEGSTIYVVGSAELAAVDATSGASLPWHPVLAGGSGGTIDTVLAVSGQTAYIGGNFSEAETPPYAPRVNLGAVDATTGELTAWEAPAPDSYVEALAISGQKVRVGGWFQFFGDQVSGPFAEVAQNATPQHHLAVAVVGDGSVSSDPTGIDCGVTCGADFAAGTSVTLSATPASGQAFVGWSGGGCTGTGGCHVTLSADTEVTATFSAVETGGPGGGGSETPAGSGASSNGGGGSTGTAPSPSGIGKTPPSSSSKPKPKALTCRKGFKKQKKRGKAKCVKVKKRRRHDG